MKIEKANQYKVSRFSLEKILIYIKSNIYIRIACLNLFFDLKNSGRNDLNKLYINNRSRDILLIKLAKDFLLQVQNYYNNLL